jgi:titin
LPKNEGGTEVVSYNLEKRESTHRAFTTVLSDCLDPNYTFKNLHTGASYYFRISANNAEGVGLHNDTDLITITETPGGVRNLQVTDTTDNSISAKW